MTTPSESENSAAEQKTSTTVGKTPLSEHRDPLEVVLTRFGDEVRQGGSPSIEDYAQQYPELADQIRELFPLVRGLENWTSDREMQCLKRNVPAEFTLKKLGEYELVREIGRGGMGVVFEALDLKLQRKVAIKLLPWRYAANMSAWKLRMQQEAATIAALQHPNIVPIYSFSEDQGYPYYVMRLVDGIGLDKLIEQLRQLRQRADRKKRRVTRPLEVPLTFDSWRGFASIGEQVALALAYAHERGVCHNDIKPSNLLIRPNRQVIITDFGIGHIPLSEISAESDDGYAVGTAMYMAPERLTGQGGPLSDVYSLGVTLYELTTQTPAFQFRKRAQLEAAIIQGKPTALRQLVPDIPHPLEAIILKAMSRLPEDRYSSARELAADFRRFIDRQPISINAGFWKRLSRRCRDWITSLRRNPR